MSHLLNDNVTFCMTLIVQKKSDLCTNIENLIKTQNANYTLFLLNDITF